MIEGIIYKYTSPSGKSYIGQTRDEKTRRARWKQTLQPYAGVKLENARKKYGVDNFQYEVLLRISCESEQDLIEILNRKEIEYIQKYDSFLSGYNSNIGGGLSQELIDSLSSSHEKVILRYNLDGEFVDEWRSAKYLEECTGIKACNVALVLKGTRYQTAGFLFKYKIDSNIPQRIQITPTKAQKQIVCKYSLDGKLISEFKSIQEAAKDCGINRNWFRQYVDGKDNHVYNNFIWKRKYAT